MPGKPAFSHAGIDTVVAALSGIAAVKGVLCFGSCAMGTCDAQSDIDLYVLCHPDIAAPETRQRALAGIDGVTELHLDQQDPAWEQSWCPAGDTFRLHGVLIDVGWHTLDHVGSVVQQVREGATAVPELQFRAHTLLGLLAHAVVLFDPDARLQRMQAALFPYPPRLRQALLRESLPILTGSLDELRNYVERGIGNTAFLFHLNRFLDALRTIIFALNARYDPATKRVEQAYATLHRLPPGFPAALPPPVGDPADGKRPAGNCPRAGNADQGV